jgi:hypothetical protein
VTIVTRAAAFVLAMVGLTLSAHQLWQHRFALHRGGAVHLVRGRELAYTELRAAAATEAQAKWLIGTYAETSLRAFRDLKVIYANDVVYCLQVEKGGRTYHLAGPRGGPRGGPASGPC